MTDDVRRSIERLVEYNWSDEAEDFALKGEPSGHIFSELRAVEQWLASLSQTEQATP